MNINWTKPISRILAFVAFVVLIVACDTIGVKKNSELSLTLNPESAGKEAGEVSVVVRASGAWSLELDFGGDEAWAELSHSVGTGYKSNIKLSYDENKTGASRSVYVIVSTENDAAEVRFTQTADGAGPDGGKADATSCGWLELPETKSGDGLLWAWHSMTTGSKRVRNYSFYWSSTEHLALWVAYPLNKDSLGVAIGRTSGTFLTRSFHGRNKPTLGTADLEAGMTAVISCHLPTGSILTAMSRHSTRPI